MEWAVALPPIPDSSRARWRGGGPAPARCRSSASAGRSAGPSSCTAVTSASISIGRPRSRSCSIEVLCAPTSPAPLMRRSTSIGKRTPSALADRLRLQHHGARDAARAVVGDDVAERAAGQRRDRIEARGCPRASPRSRCGCRRAPAPAARRRSSSSESRCDALALLARRLAEREALALDVADHARRVDLGRRIDDAADDALRSDARPRLRRRDRPPRSRVPSSGPPSL